MWTHCEKTAAIEHRSRFKIQLATLLGRHICHYWGKADNCYTLYNKSFTEEINFAPPRGLPLHNHGSCHFSTESADQPCHLPKLGQHRSPTFMFFQHFPPFPNVGPKRRAIWEDHSTSGEPVLRPSQKAEKQWTFRFKVCWKWALRHGSVPPIGLLTWSDPYFAGHHGALLNFQSRCDVIVTYAG